MPASILISQVGEESGGTPGKSRDNLVVDQVITFSNDTGESTYRWELTDVPIRSTLSRGSLGTSATFTITPDVKGTYRVTLQVNGSVLPVDNAGILARIRVTEGKTLGWRYPAAGEELTDDNIDYTGLEFPDNENTRGWATLSDLQMEQAELAAYEAANATVTSPGPGTDNLVRLNSSTGLLDLTVLPPSSLSKCSYRSIYAALPLTVPNRYQHLVSGSVLIEAGGTLTIEAGGEVVIL
jgi:hypothetical protein